MALVPICCLRRRVLTQNTYTPHVPGAWRGNISYQPPQPCARLQGWPSFFAPIDPAHIVEVVDMSIPYMPRVEVLDARSGAHLGHVFDDGGCV